MSERSWMRVGVALGVVAAIASLALAVLAVASLRDTQATGCSIKSAVQRKYDAEAQLRLDQSKNALNTAQAQDTFVNSGGALLHLLGQSKSKNASGLAIFAAYIQAEVSLVADTAHNTKSNISLSNDYAKLLRTEANHLHC